MKQNPRRLVWFTLLALLVTLIPISTFAAPAIQGSSYTGNVVATYQNCGITQVFGTVANGAGAPQAGVRLRLSWPDGSVETTSGGYIRPETNESGWDFTLDNRAKDGSWTIVVLDGAGAVASNPLTVNTTADCTSASAVNVAKVEFRQGAAAQPTPAPAPGPGPAPAPAPGGAETAPPIAAGATCSFYTQTGGGLGGFSVCDDVNAKFRTAFNRYGLQRVGYPISTRFKRDGFVTQAFQKAIFQWRPDGSYVAFVNVFDELNNRGLDQTLLEMRQTPHQFPAGYDTPGASFNQIKAARQGLLSARSAIRSAYFSVTDPLLFYGLPTSAVEDMGNHYAIRLQRAVLQEWKEDVPWARRGQVTVANGADIAKELNHLPSFALTPEPAPPTGAPAPPPAGGADLSGFRYGIQAHMIYEDLNPVIGMTKGLGFNWLKQQIEWKIWEQSPGAIDWGQMDTIAGAARTNGVKMLFSVVGAPGWAREAGYDPTVAGPPADPQTFANFLGAVAGRYCNNGVGAIEVWNEQNLHYEWGNRTISPVEYMNLLRPSYTAIKNACPSMVVISGALTPTGAPAPLAMDDFAYLEGMYQNGLKNYSDAIGSHPSGYNVPPWLDHTQACAFVTQDNASFKGPCDAPHHSWSFKSTVDGYRNIMVAYGDSGAKLWATEFGWAAGGAYHPSYGYANDNSYAEQADWTVKAYEYMRNSGFVGAAFLWNLNFRVVANGTEKAQWGIVNNAWQPLPAYNSLAAMPK